MPPSGFHVVSRDVETRSIACLPQAGVSTVRSIFKPKHQKMTYFYARATRLPKILLKITIAVGICTILCVEARAQAVADTAAAPAASGQVSKLTVGDTIPAHLWHLPLPHWNGPTTAATITLNDFNDRKLILLDFWASYCMTCLSGFPLLDSLQRVHKRELQVLLVNPEPVKDTPGRILGMYTRRFDQAPALPIVFPDTEVHRYFQIEAIPRYVWIDRSGVIQAITAKAEVTAASIHAFLTNQL